MLAADGQYGTIVLVLFNTAREVDRGQAAVEIEGDTVDVGDFRVAESEQALGIAANACDADACIHVGAAAVLSDHDGIGKRVAAVG
ncbi:MAG: hypothetical protein JW888_13780, partial [Pirellulales bacterium]|nr:hypothetical protein [Pirellulales bacterium]